jgi:hypothetical protein
MKKTLLIHVDVCSKYVTGIPFRDKSEEECPNALKQIKEIYLRNDK